MSHVYFITHPEVVVEPTVPIAKWGLSAVGFERMRKLLHQPWIESIQSIYSSTEQKATDAAGVISTHLEIPFTQIAALGENDRNSTGYLPRREFESVADEFFLKPQASIRGWETALDAQDRIVTSVESVIENEQNNGSIAIVSHGAVGALLLSRLRNGNISRHHDQPGEGGGNFYVFDRKTGNVMHGWHSFEDLKG